MNTNTTTTDRIEKQIVLKAPRSRVWRALADSQEFAAWFGMTVDGPFRAGGTVRGNPTHKGYEHVLLELVVEAMEPERRLAYRWHPNAKDPMDYSSEPMTLVEFLLEDAPGGTKLTVLESGFDALPIARRAAAFEGNSKGWTGQMTAIEKYLSQHP
jgi:uncharacterized protein YndB with AHSA1/START domain